METGLTVKNLQHHSWALMVQEQSRSGLSIRDWCSQNNISTKTFYYRRKQIRSELLQAASPVFAELVPPEGCSVSSSDGFTNWCLTPLKFYKNELNHLTELRNHNILGHI